MAQYLCINVARMTLTYIDVSVILAELSSRAFAAPTQNLCMIVSQPNGGWLGNAVLFDIDDSADTARVFDAVVAMVQQRPLEAELSINSPQSWQVKWPVRRVKPSNTVSTDISDTAYVNHQTRACWNSGRLHGAETSFGGVASAWFRNSAGRLTLRHCA